MSKFILQYDDQIDVVLDRISFPLKEFGLTIEVVNSGDGFIEYEIKKHEQ